MHLIYFFTFVVSAFVAQHYNEILTAKWEMAGTDPTIIARFILAYGPIYMYGALCFFSFFVFLWAWANDRVENKTIQFVCRLPFTVIIVIGLLILGLVYRDLFFPGMLGIPSYMG